MTIAKNRNSEASRNPFESFDSKFDTKSASRLEAKPASNFEEYLEVWLDTSPEPKLDARPNAAVDATPLATFRAGPDADSINAGLNSAQPVEPTRVKRTPLARATSLLSTARDTIKARAKSVLDRAYNAGTRAIDAIRSIRSHRERSLPVA